MQTMQRVMDRLDDIARDDALAEDFADNIGSTVEEAQTCAQQALELISDWTGTQSGEEAQYVGMNCLVSAMLRDVNENRRPVLTDAVAALCNYEGVKQPR